MPPPDGPLPPTLAIPMERRAISFAESCQRPCSYRVSECSGPTASGLHGYVCERCLSEVLARLEAGQFSAGTVCAYCGNSPAYADDLPEGMCVTCAQKGLDAARSWYRRQEHGHD